MALAETFSRKIHKLGIIPKLVKFLPIFSLLLAFASVGWLLVLPIEGQYRRTYISENALMPAQANSYFRELEWNIVRGYRQEVKDFAHWNQLARNSMVASWLQDIGLKTAIDAEFGTLYAVMNAPRGDHTELVVVAVPWMTSDMEYNEGGVALSVALARYFSKLSIWSKNIILVFPENGHLPLRKWVEGYHTSLDFLTAGSIDAAIVMEFGGLLDYFEFYEIEYEGINGQLPNLDLMNTANLIGYHEGLKYLIHGAKVDENSYFLRLRTLIRGIIKLTLTGLINPGTVSGCESFSGWQIQAITIKARGTQGAPDITQFGRIVDLTLRSVNNLLERFHQSFFFYLMLLPQYFVSIGTYLPLACLIAVLFALLSLGCVLNSGIELDIGSILSWFTGIETACYVLSVILPYAVSKTSKAKYSGNTFSGTLGSSSTNNNDSTSFTDELQASTFILYFFTLLTVVVSVTPFFNKTNRKFIKLSKNTSFLLLAFALFYIAMLIFALLTVHFTLALSIGLLALPMTWIQPIAKEIGQFRIPSVGSQVTKKEDPISKLLLFVDSHKSTFKICLCLFTSSPFFIIYIVGNYFGSENEDGALLLMRGLLTSWDQLQCWTWFVVILGWFPAWVSCGIVCAIGDLEQLPSKDEVDKKKKNE